MANLISKKAHLTEEGLSEIQSIKLNMNFFIKKITWWSPPLFYTLM